MADVLVELRKLAERRRSQRERLAAAARLTARRSWRQLDRRRLSASWDSGIGQTITRVTTAAQLAAASGAQSYVDSALTMQDVRVAVEESVVAEAFAGWASDGRSLASLLRGTLLGTISRISDGTSVDEALDIGARQLDMFIDTQVIDAGRVADGVGLVRQRAAHGYVRVLTPPSCARCAILAGRIYRSERAFERHPRCDCVHVPIGDKEAGDALKTSARDYFESLSIQEQNRIFTNAGARAIRDGADINQVVNARRGMHSAGSLKFTREGITRRGHFARRTGPMPAGRSRVPMRLTPEAIYELASDRDEAIRLLIRYGYLS